MWVVQNKAASNSASPSRTSSTTPATRAGRGPRSGQGRREAHLQALLAEHVELLGVGYTLVRREYMTAIGPVDLMCRDELGQSVAVEIKRRGEIDGVEQLTRYLDLLNGTACWRR